MNIETARVSQAWIQKYQEKDEANKAKIEGAPQLYDAMQLTM